MTRAFIRCIWGAYSIDKPISGYHCDQKLARRKNIDDDIASIKANQFNEPFVVYVYGKDNYVQLKELNLSCVLVDSDPAPFDQIKYVYRHKMELIKYAMETDGYEELVYLDWDCIPQKKLPDDFWDKMKQKSEFQACLQGYRRKKCYWRREDQRKVPNGGFLYLRDKTLPNKAIKIWETMPQDNDEPAWAKLTDEMMGGFNIDKYWELFEPTYCNIHRHSPHAQEKLNTKNVCFIHYQG